MVDKQFLFHPITLVAFQGYNPEILDLQIQQSDIFASYYPGKVI